MSADHPGSDRERELKVPEGATMNDWHRFLDAVRFTSKNGLGNYPVSIVTSPAIARHVLKTLEAYENHGLWVDQLDRVRQERNQELQRERDHAEKRAARSELDRQREHDLVSKYCEIVDRQAKEINQLESAHEELYSVVDMADRYLTGRNIEEWPTPEEIKNGFNVRVIKEKLAEMVRKYRKSPTVNEIIQEAREVFAGGGAFLIENESLGKLLDIIDDACKDKMPGKD